MPIHQELMVHDDSRSGERTLHTVATAITIFIFFTFGSPDSTIDHYAGCVSCPVYNIQICFHDARLKASWRLCLVAYLPSDITHPAPYHRILSPNHWIRCTVPYALAVMILRLLSSSGA